MDRHPVGSSAASTRRWRSEWYGHDLGGRVRGVVAVAVLLVWSALTLLLVGAHEPWRDEADPWLVARDRSPAEAIALAPYVGTPVLWHLSLMPLAKAGFPYASMNVWNWALGVVAVGLIVFGAPWPLPVSTAVIFTFLLSYEYPVIARSYQLGLMLLLAALCCLRGETGRPVLLGVLLAAAANTNVHGLIVAASLTACWLFDRWRRGRSLDRREFIGGGLALVGIALAAAQLVQPPDGQAVVARELWAPDWGVVQTALAQAWFPMRDGWPWQVAALVCQGAVFVAVWRHRAALGFLILSQVGLLMLFVFVYAGAVRHWGFLLLASLMALWWSAPEKIRPPERSRWPWWLGVSTMGLGLALTIPVAQSTWARELATDFSGSRATAAFLHSQGLADVPIAGHPAEMASAVVPYLDQPQIYYPARGEWGSHMWWDARMMRGRAISEAELFARLERAFDPARPLVLLAIDRLHGAESSGFDLLFECPPTHVADERFRVYGRNLTMPPRRRP